MKSARNLFYFLALLCVVWISGCAFPRPMMLADPNNPIKTVAVLPMVNNTNDVEAPERVREMFAVKLPERCYIYKPIPEVNQMLKDELGITLGSQLDMTNPQELGKKLGVDAVIYGTLFNFEEKTTGVLNIRRARAGFRLVDTKTGATLWGRGIGIKSETKMTGGTAGTVADVASKVGKAQDVKEGKEAKEAAEYPGAGEWHNLPAEAAYGQQYGGAGAFAAGLAEKTLKKATGTFLKRESEVMTDRIITTLPVGPGSNLCGTGSAVASVSLPAIPMPEIPQPQMPEFSMPAYFEFGKRDFTADMITTSTIKSNNEKMVFEARLAKRGDKFRSDVDMAKTMKAKGTEMPPGLGKMAFIVRPDLKMDYNLYPEKNKYLEIAIKEGKEDMPKIEKKKIGAEKIDGHPCDKFQVKITYKDGTVEEGLLWEAKDLDRFVIRAEMENKDAKTVMEMKNIKLVSPPKAFFEVPPGYKKMSGMMELFMEQDPKDNPKENP